MATVEEGMPGTKKVCYVAPPPIRPTPPLIFWTFCAGGDKHGYGKTSRSQAAPTGLPKLLPTTV